MTTRPTEQAPVYIATPQGQVGQVNFNFYLPNKILTCPAKGVIEYTFKGLFCMYYILEALNCFPAIAISVLLIKYWISFFYIVSLKLDDEILPAM